MDGILPSLRSCTPRGPVRPPQSQRSHPAESHSASRIKKIVTVSAVNAGECVDPIPEVRYKRSMSTHGLSAPQPRRPNVGAASSRFTFQGRRNRSPSQSAQPRPLASNQTQSNLIKVNRTQSKSLEWNDRANSASAELPRNAGVAAEAASNHRSFPSLGSGPQSRQIVLNRAKSCYSIRTGTGRKAHSPSKLARG